MTVKKVQKDLRAMTRLQKDAVHSVYYAGYIQDQETCPMREKMSPAKANGSSWYRGWTTEELIYGYVSESSRRNPEDSKQTQKLIRDELERRFAATIEMLDDENAKNPDGIYRYLLNI